MKLHQIALAVAALGATMAHASLPGLTAAGVPAANQVFVAGASALTGSLTSVVTAMCGGTVTTNACGSAGTVVRCSSGNATSGFSGQPFAVSKRDTDGSFAGVGNVIQATPITGWCDTTGVNTTAAIAPDAGLTDVDTKVWVGLAKTGALSVPVPAPVGVSLNGGFAGQGFGVMASEGLYRAMQVKQVNDGRLPAACSTVSPATVAGVAAADAAFTPGRCQPSISKAEYAAIVVDGNLAYTLPSAPSALTGDTNPVHICRRVETSGTQAASNVYFLNNPCANANPTSGYKTPRKVNFADGTAVVLDTATHGVAGNFEDFGGDAFTIFEGSGTGDARNCLSRRSAGNNPANVNDGLGSYAVGVVSLENAPAAGRRYLKLDGVSPNAYQVPVGSAADVAGGGAADGWAQDATQRITTVQGLYDFAPEFEMLWRTSLPANKITALNRIKTTFANPAAVSLNGVFQANGTFTHALNPTKVHKGTRSGNFCAPQTLAE